MAETKHEKFQRLRDNRLPKIVHALGLLENLGSSAYESSDAERLAVIEALDAAVDQVAKAFGVPEHSEDSPDPEVPPEPVEVQPDEIDEDPSGSDPVDPPQTQLSATAVVDDEKVPLGFIADGGSMALHEIQWAHDALQRGDKKLALNRIGRILTAVRESRK